MHFATPSNIRTTGTRGKTTTRKSTHTVRGAEGQWIADTKEELARRPKPKQWQLSIIEDDGRVLTSLYPSQERAEQAKANIDRQRNISVSGHDTQYRIDEV